MRYFLVVLLAFALLQLPPLTRLRGLNKLGVRAAIALGLGIFLSGVHHFVYLDHYVQLVPSWITVPQAIVYLSASLRVLFGLGSMVPVPKWQRVAVIGSLVLLCVVAPVNVRIAVEGVSEGQLLDADWFRWLRVAVHAGWIASCGWCLAVLPKD